MTYHQLIPAEDALEIVLSDVRPLGPEVMPITEAGGRVLASDLKALRTQPPFDASAMDGYAVRQADIQTVPAELKLVGTSRAGVPFDWDVGKGEAVRIFTGAVVPPCADSIVIQENTNSTGETVIIKQGVQAGKFIRKAGLDFTTGETLITTPTRLNARHLALAASMNYAEVPVYKKPVVALAATGDELVEPGNDIGPGKIIASNTYGLEAGIKAAGGIVSNFGIVEDKLATLVSTFNQAIDHDADLILTTGGASVGDHDLILPAARETGFEIEITKIAMRPGKPFIFGRNQANGKTRYLIGLAGNPVSSLVGFAVFVHPLIQKLSGAAATELRRKAAILGCDLPENDERAEFMRARLYMDEQGALVATPYDNQDSSMLANFVRADCLVYRPVKAPAAKSGNPCEIVELA